MEFAEESQSQFDQTAAVAGSTAALIDVITRLFAKVVFDSDAYIQANLTDSKAIGLEALMQHPEIKAVTNDANLVRGSILESKAVAISAEDEFRPLVARAEQNTIILREVSENVKEEDIAVLFSGSSVVPQSIRLDMNSTWFVIFASESESRLALDSIRGAKLDGRALKARLKTESANKSYFQQGPSVTPPQPGTDYFPPPMFSPMNMQGAPMMVPGMYFPGYQGFMGSPAPFQMMGMPPMSPPVWMPPNMPMPPPQMMGFQPQQQPPLAPMQPIGGVPGQSMPMQGMPPMPIGLPPAGNGMQQNGNMHRSPMGGRGGIVNNRNKPYGYNRFGDQQGGNGYPRDGNPLPSTTPALAAAPSVSTPPQVTGTEASSVQPAATTDVAARPVAVVSTGNNNANRGDRNTKRRDEFPANQGVRGNFNQAGGDRRREGQSGNQSVRDRSARPVGAPNGGTGTVSAASAIPVTASAPAGGVSSSVHSAGNNNSNNNTSNPSGATSSNSSARGSRASGQGRDRNGKDKDAAGAASATRKKGSTGKAAGHPTLEFNMELDFPTLKTEAADGNLNSANQKVLANPGGGYAAALLGSAAVEVAKTSSEPVHQPKVSPTSKQGSRQSDRKALDSESRKSSGHNNTAENSSTVAGAIVEVASNHTVVTAPVGSNDTSVPPVPVDAGPKLAISDVNVPLNVSPEVQNVNPSKRDTVTVVPSVSQQSDSATVNGASASDDATPTASTISIVNARPENGSLTTATAPVAENASAANTGGVWGAKKSFLDVAKAKK